MQNLRDFFQDSSSLYGSNASFIEELYEIFLENPELVESSWRDKFSQMHETADYEIAHSPIIERFAQLAQIVQ
jgi:2-oxoglutarate dehydrogenase E1 component